MITFTNHRSDDFLQSSFIARFVIGRYPVANLDILDVLQSDSRIDISLCWGTGKDTNFLYFLEKSKLLNDSIINSIHRLFASQ